MAAIGKIFVFSTLFILTSLSDVYANDPHHTEQDIAHKDLEVTVVEEEKSAFELHEEKIQESRIAKKAIKKNPTYKFKGFGSYRRDFTEICRMIEDDGQKDWILAKATEYSKSLEKCSACKTLYKALFTACSVKKAFVPKIKKKKKDDEEEGDEAKSEEEPKVKKMIERLDPSTELIDRVSITFREMTQVKSEEEANANYQALEHLIAEMRVKDDKNKVQMEYYDTLAEYIEAPFLSEGFVNNKKNFVKSPQNLPIGKSSSKIDDLF